jgi:hypothetical protein
MANLANDAGFRSRVQAAMVTAGMNVAAETVGTSGPDPGHGIYWLRHQLAVQVLNNAPGHLDQFAWAAAANVTVAAGAGSPVSIAASTSANPAAITTMTPHGLSTNQFAEISGHIVNTSINGTWQVTVTNTTVFTIPGPGVGTGAATGSVTVQPPDADIQFAVNAAFGDIAGVGVLT